MVKLISITPDVEKIIGYVARVSNPLNQDNPDVTKLLSYCIKHKHFSVFETGTMTIEITTSRAIAAQILRHRSFTFQEFSQRYSSPNNFELITARRQDIKNRQNSIDDLTSETKHWFEEAQYQVWNTSKMLYDKAIELGIAKECARTLLPLSTQTTMYMTGNIRSWMTYFQVRLESSTQLEHREIAKKCWEIFQKQLPDISSTLKKLEPEVFK